MWSWTSRDRKASNNNATRSPGLAPLSRFEPVHKREEPVARSNGHAETNGSQFSKRSAPSGPLTPLNQLIHADAAEQADAPKATAPVAAVPQSNHGSGYLTGLEEEPPISISILRRALPERFETASEQD